MNISNNVSSIQAHQTWLDNSAQNIANVNTDGYIPTQTTLKGEDPVTANSSKSDDNGSQKSQTDLSKELPDQIMVNAGVAVNVSTIKTQDEMLGTLLDLKS